MSNVSDFTASMQGADLRRSKAKLCSRRQSPLSSSPSSAWLVGSQGLSRIELFAHSVETELVNYGRTEIWRASNISISAKRRFLSKSRRTDYVRIPSNSLRESTMIEWRCP